MIIGSAHSKIESMFGDYKVSYIRNNIRIRESRELSFIRQSVSYMMAQSARTIPHAGGVVPFDVTPLVDYSRKSITTLQQREGETAEEFRLRKAVRKNFSAFFLKALAHSLFHTPLLNSVLEYRIWRDGGILHVAEDINIGYTVHTRFGVIKPIVRNAHEQKLTDVAEQMRRLTRRARKTDANELYRRAALAYFKSTLRELNFKELGGIWLVLRSLLWRRPEPHPDLENVPEEQKLQVEDILGVTATLANIGMATHGNQTVTVITPPEVMMFGLGEVHEEARVINGQVVPRHVAVMFCTFDHRAFDAGEVFPFFQHFQRYIDNPEKIYEWRPGDDV